MKKKMVGFLLMTGFLREISKFIKTDNFSCGIPITDDGGLRIMEGTFVPSNLRTALFSGV